MKPVDWEQVHSVAALLAAVALIITGNEGWAFLFFLAWVLS